MRRQGTSSAAMAAPLSVAVLLSLLLTAMIGYNVAKPQSAQADYTINAVYLTSGTTPVLDLVAVRATGIRTVLTATEMQSAAATADVIVIDRAALAKVESAWLASQYRQGKLIAGINIPIAELAAWAGFKNEQAGIEGYLQNYGGSPFYSWFYNMTEQSGVTRGGTGSDLIYGTDDFLGRLRIESQNARAQLNPQQPSTLPARPVR